MRENPDRPRNGATPRLAGRIGGLALAATHDPHEYTAAARAASPGSLDYWQTQVDPDGDLSPVERERRAVAAKKLYFVRLAALSVKARQRKRGGRGRDGDRAAA